MQEQTSDLPQCALVSIPEQTRGEEKKNHQFLFKFLTNFTENRKFSQEHDSDLCDRLDDTRSATSLFCVLFLYETRGESLHEHTRLLCLREANF